MMIYDHIHNHVIMKHFMTPTERDENRKVPLNRGKYIKLHKKTEEN